MTHDELKGLVADLAIGALDGAEARRVEAHLAGCPECAAELRSLTATAGLMRELPPIPAPTAGEASLVEGARRAAARMAEARGQARRVPRWLLGLALGGAGAAAAVLVSLQLGRAPKSRFEEGRGALEGGGAPATVAAAPPAASAPAPVLSAPAAEPMASRPASPQADVAAPLAREAEEAKVHRKERAAGLGAAAAPAPAPAPAKAPAPASAAQVADSAADRTSEVVAEAAPPAGVASERYVAPRAAKAMAKGEVAQGAPAPEVRRTPACTGETRRTLWRDADGRLVRRERAGTLGGVAYRVVETFEPTGRLAEARLEAGGRTAAADRAGVAESRLAGLVPGLEVAADAAAAEAAPPRCGP